MGSKVFFPVLATGEEADFTIKVFAQALHEELEGANVDAVVVRKMFVRVGERDERVVLVRLTLVIAASCPLIDAVDPATDTAPAGERDRQLGVDGFERIEGNTGFPGTVVFLDGPEPLQWFVAGHVRLEADTAAHRIAQVVFPV